MKTLFKIGVHLASVASAVVAVPQVSFAAQPVSVQQQEVVQDVSLAKGKVLSGQIVTSNGQPRSNVPVILGQKGKQLAKTTTNENGQFQFQGVPSGMFHVSAGAKGGMYRIWSEHTAPPSAKTGVLIVNNETVVRANLGDWWGSLSSARKALLVAGGVAAVAVPIAVAQDDDDDAS